MFGGLDRQNLGGAKHDVPRFTPVFHPTPWRACAATDAQRRRATQIIMLRVAGAASDQVARWPRLATHSDRSRVLPGPIGSLSDIGRRA